MRTPPFEDPDVSYLEFQGLATMVEDLEESLSDTQRELLRMVVYEKLSFREIARQLGISKSSSHRAWQALAVKLREILMSEPAVQDHLHGG